MENPVCEVRLDIALPDEFSARRFETAWRKTLAAQNMTALATPPACAVAVRFRVCGAGANTEHLSPLHRHLEARLSVLPGTPVVTAEATVTESEWRGVKIWLSYRAADLPALLRCARQKNLPAFLRPHFIRPNLIRGHRS